MNIQDLINADVEFGVSEPADFHLENGSGPYRGKINSIEDDMAIISLSSKLFYKGNPIVQIKVRPRHVGETLLDWDISKVLIVNLVVNIPTLSHMVGGARIIKEASKG